MSVANDIIKVPRLQMEEIIGFNGDSVKSGLHVHPNSENLIYALGCDVFINGLPDSPQQSHCALSGHNSDVSCIAVSKDGRFIASGCKTHMGFKADIIVWDFESRTQYAKFSLHNVKVEALAFSPSGKFLVSLGGNDDGNAVVWNLETREAICGSPAQVKSAGNTTCIAFANRSDYKFVTGGENTLRIWDLDVDNRKIKAEDVNMAITRRTVNCIEISPDDETIYCGSQTGDIFSVSMSMKILVDINSYQDKAHNFSMGVNSLCFLKNNPTGAQLLAGAGDGTMALVNLVVKKQAKTAKPAKPTKAFKIEKKHALDSCVTAITLRGAGHQFFVGTKKGQIYRFNLSTFDCKMCQTSHYGAINDITFAPNCDQLFATCSHEDIRVWDTKASKELLRIHVPNMTCNAICFKPDGKCILSGWNDGIIRAFAPESGKLMFDIKYAHSQGVSALAYIAEQDLIISGGVEGQVRVWQVVQDFMKPKVFTSTMKHSMNEHTGQVSSLKVNSSQIVSTSHDGQCIVWNIETFTREKAMSANTLFKCVCFGRHPFQLIASGTDRKITYYNVLDGSQIRECEGSMSGSINGMDITRNGDIFVTAGEDRIVKVWNFDEGEVTHVGIGHTGQITKVVISPQMRYILSAGIDGAIIRWGFPSC